jgi:hypothetical protein
VQGFRTGSLTVGRAQGPGDHPGSRRTEGSVGCLGKQHLERQHQSHGGQSAAAEPRDYHTFDHRHHQL